MLHLVDLSDYNLKRSETALPFVDFPRDINPQDHGPFFRIFMRKVTKVIEIEIEVWTRTDLFNILNKIGHGGWRCAK